jgi:hypothetical protein
VQTLHVLRRRSQQPAGGACEGTYCPVSKLHCAPPPAFCMISLGSIVQRNLEMLSMLEPAAPSEGMPAAAIVAPTSLASRPVLGRKSPSCPRANVHRDGIADQAVQHHRGEPAAALAHRT